MRSNLDSVFFYLNLNNIFHGRFLLIWLRFFKSNDDKIGDTVVCLYVHIARRFWKMSECLSTLVLSKVSAAKREKKATQTGAHSKNDEPHGRARLSVSLLLFFCHSPPPQLTGWVPFIPSPELYMYLRRWSFWKEKMKHTNEIKKKGHFLFFYFFLLITSSG